MGVPLNINELVGVDVVDEGKYNLIIEVSLEVGAGFLGRAQPVLEIGAASGGDLVFDAVRTFARGVRACSQFGNLGVAFQARKTGVDLAGENGLFLAKELIVSRSSAPGLIVRVVSFVRSYSNYTLSV